MTNSHLFQERVQTHIGSLGHPLVFMAMKNPNMYKHLPGFKQKLQLAADSGKYLVKFFCDRIEDHERDFIEEEEAKDYVNA